MVSRTSYSEPLKVIVMELSADGSRPKTPKRHFIIKTYPKGPTVDDINPALPIIRNIP